MRIHISQNHKQNFSHMKNIVIASITSIVLLGCALGLVYGQSEADKPVYRKKIYRIEELVKSLEGNPTSSSDIKELMNLAEDENPVVRTNAVSALGTVSSGYHEALKGLVVPFLSDKLGDEVQSVRRAAAKSLGSFGKHALEAVPSLIEAARSDYNSDAGWFSAEAIGNIGPEAKEGIPTLIWMLGVNRENSQVSETAREYALDALVKMGSHAEDALPSLLELLKVAGPKMKGKIVQAIYQIDRLNPEIEKALINLYRSNDVWSRYYAVKVVESFDANNMPAFANELLLQAIHDKDKDIRSIAMRLLNK